MKILLLSLGVLFAAELEVEGNLTVTGDINSPTIDALSGMKPERIYLFQRGYNQDYSFTVPENKIWVISGHSNSTIFVNINGLVVIVSDKSVIAFSGMNISDAYDDQAIFNIYEYSISASGTDQGMDYIIP